MSNTIYCGTHKDMDAVPRHATIACALCKAMSGLPLQDASYHKDPEDDIVMLIVEVEGQATICPCTQAT